MDTSSSLEHIGLPSQVTGFFTWDVPNNLIFGDENFADIYRLRPERLAVGVAVEDLLALVAPEDREQLAKRIHDVLLGSKAAVSSYTVAFSDGERRAVSSVGTCFRDAEGVPSYYAGVVMWSQDKPRTLDDNALRGHIDAAMLIAEAEGRELTRRYLSSALGSLGPASK